MNGLDKVLELVGEGASVRQKDAISHLQKMGMPRKIRSFFGLWKFQSATKVVAPRVTASTLKGLSIKPSDAKDKGLKQELFSTFGGQSVMQELHIALQPQLFVLELPDNFSGRVEIETVPGTHLLILTGNNSKITVIERLKKSAVPTTLSCGVEVILGENCQMDYIYTQASGNQNLLQHRTAKVGKSSLLQWFIIILGGDLSWNEVHTILNGEQSCARIYGIYHTQLTEKIRMQYTLEHAAPHTTGDILVHGIGRDASYSNFQGNIVITRSGTQTDTHLTERCLLLSTKAKHDTMPMLEIDTNDVKATHSASVTQIDEAFLFYTQSRGIPLEEARQLIVQSFLESVYGKIPEENEREKIKDLLNKP